LTTTSIDLYWVNKCGEFIDQAYTFLIIHLLKIATIL
jgi:hypothetical protein